MSYTKYVLQTKLLWARDNSRNTIFMEGQIDQSELKLSRTMMPSFNHFRYKCLFVLFTNHHRQMILITGVKQSNINMGKQAKNHRKLALIDDSI